MDQLTPQQKAIIAADELRKNGRISSARVRELTGLGKFGAWRLLAVTLCKIYPVWYDEFNKEWVYGYQGDNQLVVE